MRINKNFFIPLFEETLEIENIGKNVGKLITENLKNREIINFYENFVYKIGLKLKNLKKDKMDNYIIICDFILYSDIPKSSLKDKIENIKFPNLILSFYTELIECYFQNTDYFVEIRYFNDEVYIYLNNVGK